MRWNSYRYALAAMFMALPAAVQAQTTDMNLYVRCSFYPQGQGCDSAYQQALHDQSPAAASVRDAFKYYARYLKPDAAGLTEGDKRYLVQNGIRAPFDLTAADVAGLHNVINDPSLAADSAARRLAVNAFIARAVQAELYCGTRDCPDNKGSLSS